MSSRYFDSMQPEMKQNILKCQLCRHSRLSCSVFASVLCVCAMYACTQARTSTDFQRCAHRSNVYLVAGNVWASTATDWYALRVRVSGTGLRKRSWRNVETWVQLLFYNKDLQTKCERVSVSAYVCVCVCIMPCRFDWAHATFVIYPSLKFNATAWARS